MNATNPTWPTECLEKFSLYTFYIQFRMKLQYFGHVTGGSAGNLALTVLEGSVDGLRHQGRHKRQWMDDIEEWSGVVVATFS